MVFHYIADFIVFFPMLIGVVGLLSRARSDRIWLASIFALTFALVGALIALVGSYLESGFEIQRWTLSNWASHWGFDVGLKVDFFSATQAFLVAWLFLTSFLLARGSFSKHRSKVVASLTLCSAMLAAVLSANLLSFLVFSSVSSLFAAFLLGLEKSDYGPQDAVRLGMVALTSELLLLICVLGTNKQLVGSDVLNFILLGKNISGETVLFFIFLIAALFKTPLLPFHPHHSGIYRSTELEHLLPRAVLGGLGVYLIFRFAPQLYPNQLKEFAGTLMGFGMFSIIAGGVYVFRAKGIRAWLFASGLIASGLAISGFASVTSLGWLGAWVVHWFGAVALALAIGLCVAAERRSRPFGVDALVDAPLFGISSILAILALGGMPISVFYFGVVFVFGGATSIFSGFAWVAFVSLPLILGGIIYRLFFQFQAGGRESPGGAFSDLTLDERVALSPLLVFLIATFLCSGFLLSGISRAVSGAMAAFGWGG